MREQDFDSGQLQHSAHYDLTPMPLLRASKETYREVLKLTSEA